MTNEDDRNEEDTNEEDSAEDEGDTSTHLLENDAHDSGDSVARSRDTATNRARAYPRATDTAEDTQIKEVDTSTDGDETEDDAEDDAEEYDEYRDLDDTNSRENSADKQQTEPKKSHRVKKTTSCITSGNNVVNQQVVTKHLQNSQIGRQEQTILRHQFLVMFFALKIAKN